MTVTAAVLFAGLWAFKNKNTVLSQRMMRLRVLAQAATVVAMTGGALSLGGGEHTHASSRPKPKPFNAADFDGKET